MNKIKISVVKVTHYMDLSNKYENKITHACAMYVGLDFISIDAKRPDGLCPSAWLSIEPYVKKLASGIYNLHDGWMKNPKSAMVSCNDGFRPVSFYLEVIE